MKPLLVFQTDFTYKEGAVAAMYGVVKCVDRELEILDATHEIPQYDIYSASYRLYQYLNFYPKGTIFVSVVDPGVGTKRRGAVVRVNDYYVVTPDNGTLTYLKKYCDIKEVREIDLNVNKLKGKDTEDVSIFHGRDVFGYTAAKLASGVIDYEGVGPKYDVDEIVTFDLLSPTYDSGVFKGIIEIEDPNFGNIWSNIPINLLLENGIKYGEFLNVKISHLGKEVFNKNIYFSKAFGDVKKGEDVIYHNELNNVSLAICMGNFMEKYDIGFGHEWLIEIGGLKNE